MKKGFTLIEMLVVGGITAILFSVTVYVLFMSTRVAKKSQLESLVTEQANWLMSELDKNLSKAEVGTINCGGSTISFYDRDFGNDTTITCNEGARVASASASKATDFDLTSDEVGVIGCTSFFSCSFLASPQPVIDIEFTMVAGNITGKNEDYVERNFKTSVVVRE